MKINTIDDIYSFKFDDLDKSLKYMIVGVRKSGTQSLKQYMLDNGFDVECFEMRFTMPEYYTTHDYTRIPIVVIRHCVERAWSDYEYFKDYDPPINPNGLDDAVESSKYEKYLKHWTNPIIFTLGYLKELDGFPYVNTNEMKGDIPENTKNELGTKLNYSY